MPLHTTDVRPPPPAEDQATPTTPAPQRSRAATVATWALYGTAAAAVVAGVGLAVATGVALVAALGALAGVLVPLGKHIHDADERRAAQAAAAAQKEQEAAEDGPRRLHLLMGDISNANAAGKASGVLMLLPFLRSGGVECRKDIYFYTLAHLRTGTPDAVVDAAFVRVFERAAHEVLPYLSAKEHRLAVDFSQARLDEVDLSGLELSEANLTAASLRNATLDGCCLWRAHGSGTDLSGASLRNANLEEVVLIDRAKAEGTDFSYANLVGSRFTSRRRHRLHKPDEGPQARGARLRDASFVGARCQGAVLDGADLEYARFNGANLKGASFLGVSRDTTMEKSVLTSVSGTWRSATWDWTTLCALGSLESWRRRGKGQVPAMPKRKRTDIAAAHYRQHPFPGHPDPLPRSRTIRMSS